MYHFRLRGTKKVTYILVLFIRNNQLLQYPSLNPSQPPPLTKKAPNRTLNNLLCHKHRVTIERTSSYREFNWLPWELFLVLQQWWHHIHLGSVSLVKSCDEKSVTFILLKKLFPSRQHLNSCNNLWNNILSRLMSKYSCVTKDLTCLI